MGENKFDEEDLRKYVNCKVHLKVGSESMEPSTFNLRSLGFRDKLPSTLISIKDPSSSELKVEPKYSSSSGLRQHDIYPSWININIFGVWTFLKTY